MSQFVRGILGVIAVAGTLSVAQLAMGGDLGQIGASRSILTGPSGAGQDVNRAAKADRAALPQASQPGGQTVGVSLVGQSVLVRIPGEQVGVAERTRTMIQPSTAPRKAMVACEPVVSVLTDVAKQLQPGRCMT